MPQPSETDIALVRLVVAELLRRQPLETNTDEFVRVAVQFNDRASTVLRLLRDEAAVAPKKA